jgi:hypothetical protein
MLFEICLTRSYVVSEEARATVEAAIAEEAVEAARSDLDALPWETTDEEPNQDLEIACERVQERQADFRAVGGTLVARES